MTLYLSDLPPQSHYEKDIRQSPMKGHSTKYLHNTPQNCQGYQKEEIVSG